MIIAAIVGWHTTGHRPSSTGRRRSSPETPRWPRQVARLARNFGIMLGLSLIAATSALGQAQSFSTARADGSTIEWQLDLPAATAGEYPLMVLAQGSGCDPAMTSPSLQTTKRVFASFATLTVEKYGVYPGDKPAGGGTGDCSPEFHRHNTMGQRVGDYARVLEELRGAPWWNGKLVLLGGSEGGLVMGRLASLVDADAAILISTGGGVTFGDMIRSSIPPEGHPTVEAEFEKIRQNPDGDASWGGYTYRFWADSLDRRVADDMLSARTAFLLVQGTRDRASTAAARATVDIFAEADRCNLTYWEFPAYDHAFARKDGISGLSGVLTQALSWLTDELTRPGCS